MRRSVAAAGRAVLLAAALIARAHAADEPCGVAAGEAQIVRLEETGAAVLADGRTLRLADVAPVAPLPETAGAAMIVAPAGGATDRWDRLLGDLVPKATGRSLREELIENGLAFVDPTVMSEACLQTLFAVERSAETARRGVWAENPVIDADSPALAEATGRMVIVAGTVRTIGETKETIYLNFGDNYRTDFTVIVRKAAARGWADAAKALKGRRIRVRGLLEAWNGGLIRVEHPAQIDALEGTAPSR